MYGGSEAGNKKKLIKWYDKNENNLEDSRNFRQKGVLVQSDHLFNTSEQVLLGFWILMSETQKQDAVLLHL
jgi:hypothetical protein